MDHIYIACLRLYFLNYLDSYRYAPKLWHVSSAIAETAETADVADAVPNLKQEKWPDAMSDLKPEESAHAFGDLEDVVDFEEESSHAFVDLEERESADSVADFEEELADDAMSVDLER